jgi:hypothetical protein
MKAAPPLVFTVWLDVGARKHGRPFKWPPMFFYSRLKIDTLKMLIQINYLN